MIILHRQNSFKDIDFSQIDGIEFDVRSHNGQLVLAHNRLATDEKSFEYLDDNLVRVKGSDKFFIVNVKEAGLEEELVYLFKAAEIKNFYFLDSQIPDIVRLSRANNFFGKFIIRVSDVESYNERLISISNAKYMWVDWNGFNEFDRFAYSKFISSLPKTINRIYVSPELYSPDFAPLISQVSECVSTDSVCTKYPELWR